MSLSNGSCRTGARGVALALELCRERNNGCRGLAGVLLALLRRKVDLGLKDRHRLVAPYQRLLGKLQVQARLRGTLGCLGNARAGLLQPPDKPREALLRRRRKAGLRGAQDALQRRPRDALWGR